MKMSKLLLVILCLFFFYQSIGQGCPTSELTLTTQEEIDEFSVNYPDCTELNNILKINGQQSNITNLNGLSQITSVKTLDIYNCSSLIDLTGLENLTSVNGNLDIGSNSNLISLEGINNLSYISGDLYIGYNTNLKNINALSNLSGGISNITFRSNDSLNSISGLENVTSIEGELSLVTQDLVNLNGLSNLQSLNSLKIISSSVSNLIGLENLTSLESMKLIGGTVGTNHGVSNIKTIGNLEVIRLQLFTSFNGFSSLVNLRRLWIEDNRFLYHLYGLENITEIQNGLVIKDSDLLDLSGLDGLQRITNGGIKIEKNFNLLNIDPLINLESINGHFQIIDNNNLVDISGMVNVDPFSIRKLQITNNQNLSNCAIDNICDFFDMSVDGWSEIYGNATGCNSKFEIADECGIVLSTGEEAFQQVSVYPNPTNGVITINGIDRGNVRIINTLGQVILEANLDNDQVDLSGISNGLYFVEIDTDNKTSVVRLIKK